MSQTLVMKFGGTSVGSVRALGQLIGIVGTARETWPRVAVVVSAMSGVTDTLLAGAQRAVAGDEAEPARRAAELRQRHMETLEQLARLNNAAVARAAIEACLQEFQTLCHAVRVLGEA